MADSSNQFVNTHIIRVKLIFWYIFNDKNNAVSYIYTLYNRYGHYVISSLCRDLIKLFINMVTVHQNNSIIIL